MGKELGQYVFEKYDQSVVHVNCIFDIAADIKEKMQELSEKYPKCRPFKYEFVPHRDRYREYAPDISVKPENKFNDNYVFILRTKSIRKMNLETSLNF